MSTQDWILYFGIPIIALVCWFGYQGYKNYKKTLKKIEESFGQIPKSKYTYEEFENISHDYLINSPDTKFSIDDITWNDFNMDDIFKQMDSSQSSFGRENLYSLLRHTNNDDAELKERTRIMDYFRDHSKERKYLLYEYHKFGFSKKISMADYISTLCGCPVKSPLIHIILMLVFFASIGYCIFGDSVNGLGFLFVVLGINIISYYKFKADIEDYLLCVKRVFAMCHTAKQIVKLDIDGIKEYNDKINSILKNFDDVMSFSFVMSSTGNPFDFILDYVRMLTHMDIIKFCSVAKKLNKKSDDVWALYHTLGYIEALICASSYRETLSICCQPEFANNNIYNISDNISDNSSDFSHSNTTPFIDATDICHPLITEPVPNSIKTNGSVLLTGSNASGKSTFLRSVGINAILAQTLNFCAAKSYQACRFRIYSSMALNDSILNKESYYMVEIRSLKRILDAAEDTSMDNYPVLCFIDEVLRGTNTIERIAASSQILKKISQCNTLCFAATHDIELTSILERYFTNYHFTEEITDDDIHFSYKLLSGRATSRNAIKLLGLLGYEKELLATANQTAADFENNGTWSRL